MLCFELDEFDVKSNLRDLNLNGKVHRRNYNEILRGQIMYIVDFLVHREVLLTIK